MERIDRISPGSYIGYYWMSDALDPVIIDSCDVSVADRLNNIMSEAESNPFVVEAQLYDASAHVSFSIKYVDSRYLVHRHDVKAHIEEVVKGKTDDIVMKRYVANRLTDRKLCFLQYWREQVDPFCCGMPVLAPAEKVFVGFETLNDNEK